MAHRILIIDDEEDIRTVAAMALDLDPAMDVRTCGSGAEGVQIADWWQPHLILLDVRMPSLSGPDTLKQLRGGARTASIPVLFFTASVQKHERDALLLSGAEGIIVKPFDPMALPETISAYLPAPETGDPAQDATIPEAGLAAHPNHSIESLLYVSRSRLAPDEAEIEVKRIVATARGRNGPAEITGGLVFTHTHFAQYLEGPKAALDELMARLQEDRRHGDIRLVSTRPSSQRYFSAWSMAYGGSSLYVAHLVARAFEDPADSLEGNKVIRLMREFTSGARHAA